MSTICRIMTQKEALDFDQKEDLEIIKAYEKHGTLLNTEIRTPWTIPRIMKAIKRQGKKIVHEPNSWENLDTPILKLNGTYYRVYTVKKRNVFPWKRVWSSRICYKTKQKSLGVYEDPVTAHIVYKLVYKEFDRRNFYGRELVES